MQSLNNIRWIFFELLNAQNRYPETPLVRQMGVEHLLDLLSPLVRQVTNQQNLNVFQERDHTKPQLPKTDYHELHYPFSYHILTTQSSSDNSFGNPLVFATVISPSKGYPGGILRVYITVPPFPTNILTRPSSWIQSTAWLQKKKWTI